MQVACRLQAAERRTRAPYGRGSCSGQTPAACDAAPTPGVVDSGAWAGGRLRVSLVQLATQLPRLCVCVWCRLPWVTSLSFGPASVSTACIARRPIFTAPCIFTAAAPADTSPALYRGRRIFRKSWPAPPIGSNTDHRCSRLEGAPRRATGVTGVTGSTPPQAFVGWGFDCSLVGVCL